MFHHLLCGFISPPLGEGRISPGREPVGSPTPWFYYYTAPPVPKETSVLQDLTGVRPVPGSLPFLTPGFFNTFLLRKAPISIRIELTTSECGSPLKTQINDQAGEWGHL